MQSPKQQLSVQPTSLRYLVNTGLLLFVLNRDELDWPSFHYSKYTSTSTLPSSSLRFFSALLHFLLFTLESVRFLPRTCYECVKVSNFETDLKKVRKKLHFFFKKRNFGGHKSFLWGHCFELLVTRHFHELWHLLVVWQRFNKCVEHIHYRPQTKFRESNVFTPFCDSVHGGKGRGSLFKGVSAQGGSVSEMFPPGMVEEWAVLILLECILVYSTKSTLVYWYPEIDSDAFKCTYATLNVDLKFI